MRRSKGPYDATGIKKARAWAPKLPKLYEQGTAQPLSLGGRGGARPPSIQWPDIKNESENYLRMQLLRAEDGRVGRVLIVEDDESIRALVERILDGEGIEALGAATGDDALQILRDDPRPLSLAIGESACPT